MEPCLSNDSQVKQFRVRPKNLSKKCLSDQTNVWSLNTRSQADENGTHTNDCQGKLNAAELLAESTPSSTVSSVVEHNFWNKLCLTTEVPLYILWMNWSIRQF